MNNQQGKYFENPAFCEYIFLLVELERLIREDRNELPEGEAIYAEMDSPADKLDGQEMEAVSVFAAELTRLSGRYGPILLPTQASPIVSSKGTVAPPSSRTTNPAASSQELVP